MGQYWIPVNLDKREFVNPLKLGAGSKLREQLANHPGTGAALIVLCAAMPETRGGGDFDLDDNWHGPERTFPEHNISPGQMPESYPEVAKRTVGHWAGDRIALVGDYAEDDDLLNCGTEGTEGIDDTPLSRVYDLCHEGGFTDITDDVRAVIAHELCGEFVGDGWCEFKYNER
jgi:hypothetical protein